MSLAVVTLTRGARPEWLEECAESVDFGQHQVHVCPGTFQSTRWAATMGAGTTYVAWLDDDDRVMPGALERCVQALEATGAGMAFTHEARINKFGERIGTVDSGVRCRRDLAMHPRSIHHLTVFRASAFSPGIYEHAQRIGIGIDWLFRAYVGLRHGAVQVPMVGAEWRQHQAQDIRSRGFADAYARAMPQLREITRQWMGPLDSQIPIFLEGAS